MADAILAAYVFVILAETVGLGRLQLAVGLASLAAILALDHAAPGMFGAHWARSLRRFLDVVFVVGWLVTVTVTSVSYWQAARLEWAQYCRTYAYEIVCRR